ncbi:Mitochondrial import inner membrane translocase subunit tim22 [Conglomerata obtusa]
MYASLKAKLQTLKPCVIKTVTHGVQGYMFGCMVGIFSNTKNQTKATDFLKNMHSNGVTFAKVGVVYAGTECILESVRDKRCVWNSVASGIVAGSVVGKGNVMLSGISFGAYSGLTDYYSMKDE